jgi:hypothetical protein
LHTKGFFAKIYMSNSHAEALRYYTWRKETSNEASGFNGSDRYERKGKRLSL